MRTMTVLMSAAACLLCSAISLQAFGDDCSKYYGKGYCVDYIKQRTGKKPSGDAGSWTPNIDPKAVRRGDVAIFSSPAPWGHVAMVERVICEKSTTKPSEIEISEWNWGAKMVNRGCAVTDMFGKTSARNRTVKVSAAKGYWRP